QCRQPVVLAFRPAIFDPQIVADEKASFAQSLAERGQQNILLKVSRSRTEITDGPWRRLLRARRKRPRRRAAKKRDELAAPHPITSSASANNLSGTSSPSALAVLRLITSSNLLDCTTGKSEVLAPLRMRAT